MKLLILGSSGYDVKVLQSRLTRAGYKLVEDGDFGNATFKALLAFQRDYRLLDDGVAGPKTMQVLLEVIGGSEGGHRWISHEDLERAAEQLGVPVACVKAVYQVESRGAGFLSDGRPVILFERHIMYRRLKAAGYRSESLGRLVANHPNLVSEQTGGYSGGETEHYRLNQACEIDRDSALESASWGLFQIMGFHWKALKYQSAAHFAEMMSESEGAQLDAFVRFILADAKLLDALKNLDWNGFARRYNGPGYKKNSYHTKLAAVYAAAQEG